MGKPLVSIITPVFNSGIFLAETINSIISQSYTNWEMLITDDNSSDKSVDIINSYVKKDSRIKLYQLKNNSGAGVARNNSILNAKGRFIAFCDSDDSWHPEKLKMQVAYLIKNNLIFTYSGYEIVDEQDVNKGIVIPPLEINYKKMLKNNYIGCLTAIYDSKKIGKQFMPEIRKRQDWLLWLNILKKYGATKGQPEILAKYRNRDKSISSNKIELLKYNWLVYNKGLGFNKLKSIILLLFFMYYYARKKLLK